MTADAITARLRQALELGAALGPASRVDMSSAAITGRLADASALSDLCLRLGQIGRAAALGERLDEAPGHR